MNAKRGRRRRRRRRRRIIIIIITRPPKVTSDFERGVFKMSRCMLLTMKARKAVETLDTKCI